MNTELLLQTLRLSAPFKQIGVSSDAGDSYYRGRRIAQHTSRHGITPLLRGNYEVLGFMEYVLEHANDQSK